MRYLRSLLLLLLVFVLSLDLCSISSYALDNCNIDHDYVDGDPADSLEEVLYPIDSDSPPYFSSFALTPDDDSMMSSLYLLHYVYSDVGYGFSASSSIGRDTSDGTTVFGTSNYTTTKGTKAFRDYFVIHANGEPVFERGDSALIKIDNLLSELFVGSSYSGTEYPVINTDSFELACVQLMDKSGEVLEVSPSFFELVYNSSNNTYSLEVEINSFPFDVTRVSVLVDLPASAFGSSVNLNTTSYKRYFGFVDSTIDIEVTGPSENSGLLATIIEWLRNIRDNITSLGSSIVSLPSRIWSFISDGLISLFVPSESDMVEYSDKWDELLADRLGLVYESSAIINDFGESLSSSTSSASMSRSGAVINIPSVTVNLAGTPFTFGGYSVPVIPAGFEWIQPYSKTITSIVSVFLFLNGLRRRWDGIIGG